jgi:hypothetical protein
MSFQRFPFGTQLACQRLGPVRTFISEGAPHTSIRAKFAAWVRLVANDQSKKPKSIRLFIAQSR